MKIRTFAHICPICSYKVSTYGYPCTVLIELAIAHYLKKSPLTFNDRDYNDRLFKIPLQYLETKGFLISTECDDIHIQILPNMREAFYDEQEKRFCWC